MEILETGMIRVKYSEQEIIKRYTKVGMQGTCIPWIETRQKDDVYLNCECGHYDLKKISLIGYTSHELIEKRASSRKVNFEVEVRNFDVDNNPINVSKVISKMLTSLAAFWDCKSVGIKE